MVNRVFLLPASAAAIEPHSSLLPSLATIELIALVVGVPVLAAGLMMLIAWWTRAALRRRRRGDARLRAARSLESGARTVMSELCPHGWSAQLTLFGTGAELPSGAPPGTRAQVALDWAEFAGEDRHVAVQRRVWAATIADALEAMVEDRRTDETLEEIERHAPAWPD